MIIIDDVGQKYTIYENQTKKYQFYYITNFKKALPHEYVSTISNIHYSKALPFH